MEIVLSLAIGVLGGLGVWLVLRPRTFQVLMGLSLLSYAVNLFIFSMGSLSIDKPSRSCVPGVPADLLHYTDPMPQALVLTAIVIGFATTALFLVVLLAARGLTRHRPRRRRGGATVTRRVVGDRLIAAPDRRADPAAAARRRADAAARRRAGAAPRRSSASSSCRRWASLLAVALLLLGGPTATPAARSASTCPATGRCPSASCSWSTGCRR